MQELESERQNGNPGLDQMNSEISRVLIRPLTRDDLPQARRIFCAAFGTFLGASDPENFWADRDYVNGRFGPEHVASFAAELDGELVGSNFAIRWGSLGFFGPNIHVVDIRVGAQIRRGVTAGNHQARQILAALGISDREPLQAKSSTKMAA
jgi:hypothetical protein